MLLRACMRVLEPCTHFVLKIFAAIFFGRPRTWDLVIFTEMLGLFEHSRDKSSYKTVEFAIKRLKINRFCKLFFVCTSTFQHLY